MLTHEQADKELQKRVKHFIQTHDLPFIAKFLNDYASKALGAKFNAHHLTRIARFIENEKLHKNVSEAVRRLVLFGLSHYEQENGLSSDIPIATVPEQLPAVVEQIVEQQHTPVIKPSEPVPVPVRKLEPEEPAKAPEPDLDDDFVF